MATINPRYDKSGNIISYQIRVFRGRDSSGKRLKDYMMTWRPDPSMTKRQIEREVQRQATLFEENCKIGNVSTEKMTFERYAAYVIDLKERTGLKAKTVERYRDMLPRINAEIGPLKLQDIRADHLNRLYAKLAAEGENKTGGRAVAKIDLKAVLKDGKLRQARIVERTGVSSTTVSDAIKGHTVSTKTAQAVANALGMKLEDAFDIVEGSTTLAAKTIVEHHRLISSIFSQAVKEQLVPSNTARRATPPKVPKHELDTFEADEVKAILDALMTEPLKWQVITMLLIGTGARRGEIMGLQWKNVDFDNSRLYLCENRVYTRTTGAISTTLKTDESRYVTISPSITALLRQWKEEQAAFFDHLGITPSGYVATADSGKPMHPDSPTDWLANFAKRHDLPPIHPHKFRHTQASLLISEGVDILTVSKRLGHAKVSTTLDIYSHVLAKSDRQASDALDALIFQKKEG
ncbi:MAG: tyrosine-type recombinase/integrase [Oscillospiraceae bacterium]|nr:tyrosine-type recombinase/integrase [Oscillospiraceae bacterium]